MEETWRTDRWRRSATAWLDERLAAAGLRRTGAVEQPHLRPWATVLRAPTTGGPVWLKAAGPGTAFETGLYDLLRRVAPDRILEPLAVDTGRGWLLLPDGGPSLGEAYEGDELVAALALALPQYAQLQRDLAGYTGDLLALGVADMRPARMPGRFDEALAAVDVGPDRERLAALRPVFAGWCAELAAAPGAASLDHNDLHAWNVFGGGRFYDWGDSVVAHPFASLLAGLVFMRQVLGADAGDPRIVRLRDAYLEPFTDLGSRAELVATAELACRVAKAARALTWLRAVRALAATSDSRYADAPRQSMVALLDESPWTGA